MTEHLTHFDNKMFRNNLFIQTVFIFHQVKEKHSLLRKINDFFPAINKISKKGGKTAPHLYIITIITFNQQEV